MKVNQVKAGAFMNLLSLMISNLIPFIYTPIMLRLLGRAEYGLYGIASSFMGYINLLNFGIGGTIVRYIAKYRAQDDKQGEERMFGLFVKIYGVIGAAILVAGTVLSLNLDFYDRSLTGEELVLLKKLVMIMTLNTALFLPLSPFSAIVTAHERFVFSKCMSMLFTMLAPIVNLILLYNGFGSVGLTFCSMLSNIITYAVYIPYVIKKLGIRPRFSKAPSGILREIFGYSAFVFLGHVVDMLYWSTDKLIIGWAIGTVGTAVYNIGASFNVYITSISTAISGVLLPRVTSMAVKDTPKKEFTDLFIKVGRLQFIIISFILSAFVAFGRQFIALWAGPGYEDAYFVALLTMIPVTVPLIQNTGLNILYATNRHKFRSTVYSFIAGVNVVLTFWWVEGYGIVGAAVATCIAYVIGNILIINWYYYKKIGIDIPLFWKNILKMSPVMILMGTAWWFILDGVVFTSWLMFLGYAVVYAVIYVLLTYFFMMNKYEKNLLFGPVKRILKKIRKR
ncbi:MAG: oligosaccharide flippase family protein [Oscillospiraceae bacterium]|nr:oligosaccharide flippase family protein [Oscillospiraceae bacterium]